MNAPACWKSLSAPIGNISNAQPSLSCTFYLFVIPFTSFFYIILLNLIKESLFPGGRNPSSLKGKKKKKKKKNFVNNKLLFLSNYLQFSL